MTETAFGRAAKKVLVGTGWPQLAIPGLGARLGWPAAVSRETRPAPHVFHVKPPQRPLLVSRETTTGTRRFT